MEQIGRKEGNDIYEAKNKNILFLCAQLFHVLLLLLHAPRKKERGLINGVIIEGLNIKTTASLLFH